MTRALSGSTCLLVVASWRLWSVGPDFPVIPFVPSVPQPGIIGPAALVIGLLLSLNRATARPAIGATALLFVWLILGDQLRFQPWAYQFVVMGMLLALVPGPRARAYCRAYLIALYAFSGLSKLDGSFVREMGPLLVGELARVVGAGRVDLGRWVLVLPVGELVVAGLLAMPRTRRVGFAGAVLMHAALLIILGPIGLRHGVTVLIWNLALIAEGACLFLNRDQDEPRPSRRSGVQIAVGIVMAGVILGPIGERFGWFDSWPSHALYASHCEWSMIRIGPGDRFRRLPEALRLASEVPPGESHWRVDLTAWCRSTRGVPAYPQWRYANGVAEWIAGRVGPGGEVSVEHHSRASPVSSSRTTIEARGLDAIRRLGDTCRLNAHPGGVP